MIEALMSNEPPRIKHYRMASFGEGLAECNYGTKREGILGAVQEPKIEDKLGRF
nr:MAG TPA: hypothetical protein [Caudoviricetes sp.]